MERWDSSPFGQHHQGAVVPAGLVAEEKAWQHCRGRRRCYYSVNLEVCRRTLEEKYLTVS